jgi:uncharacterized protein YbjQ (UPF0145 family)
MKITTLETIAARSIDETLGYVRGTTVWSRRTMKNKTVGLRALEIMNTNDIADGLMQARDEAEAKMIQSAADKGADAIIAVRVELIDLGNQTFQAIASGTAVRTSEITAAPVIEAPVFARPANDTGMIIPFAPRRAARA